MNFVFGVKFENMENVYDPYSYKMVNLKDINPGEYQFIIISSLFLPPIPTQNWSLLPFLFFTRPSSIFPINLKFQFKVYRIYYALILILSLRCNVYHLLLIGVYFNEIPTWVIITYLWTPPVTFEHLNHFSLTLLTNYYPIFNISYPSTR